MFNITDFNQFVKERNNTMTKNQSLVCMQYHLPVEPVIKTECVEGPFYIHSITNYFSKWFRQYETVAAVSPDENPVINIKIENIKNYPEFKKVLSDKLDALMDEVTGFDYEIALEKNQRCIYSKAIDEMRPVSGYEGFIQEKTDELNKLKLKNAIKILLAAGGTKATITGEVKSIIDEINGTGKKKRKKSAFVKPTVDEINSYITEKGYKFDPEEFYNHYESNGWLVGKVPMKSWKAACATWNKKHAQFNPVQKGKLKQAPSFDIDEIQKNAMLDPIDQCRCAIEKKLTLSDKYEGQKESLVRACASDFLLSDSEINQLIEEYAHKIN